MDKPEILEILSIQDTALRQKHTHTQHNTEYQKDEQHGRTNKPVVNPGTPEGYAIPASYQTPAMLLI
jgi:hypothetical protein